ncbi:hypothetical protein RUR49_24530 [Pseudoxanthobacter sp. M-2]|uniref:hypothetical protein n=1 Tax=Pseudoxanthobacter sp. M-2 TaxID=3078754 RepID=UPI0038FCF1A7
MDEKLPVARLVRGARRPEAPPAEASATPGPDEPNVRIVRAPGATRTIVAFAGLGQLVGGMTPFNFMNSLAGIEANVVFVRDPRRTWYNGPIAGLGRSASEIAERIGALAGEAGGGSLYLLGTSSGGFAALAFAAPLAARRVLAFAPQTTIDTSVLRAIGETRWLKMLDRLRRPDIVDVLPALEAAPPAGGCEIIVGRRVPHDVVYANRLAHIAGVTVHLVRGGHNTAMHLRDRGALSTVLRDFVEDAPIDLGELRYPSE